MTHDDDPQRASGNEDFRSECAPTWVCVGYVPSTRNCSTLGVMRIRGLVYALLCSCGGTQPHGVTASATTSEASSQELRPQLTAEGACITAVMVADGVERGPICTSAAAARGLTVIDLTDTWTPTLFAPTADGQLPS